VGESNEEVAKALLEALHDPNEHVRWQMAESLSELEGGSGEMVKALLAALHDRDRDVQRKAAGSLGGLEIKDTVQLRRVLMNLNRRLYDGDYWIREVALASIHQLLDGRPIPGYRWVPLQKRRAQKQRLKRIAFWLGTAAFMVLTSLAATWLLGVLDPDSFFMRFLAVLAGIIASAAAVAQILGRAWRDPWEHS